MCILVSGRRLQGTAEATDEARRIDVSAADTAVGSRRWWSVRDIAADLGVSINTVYKWSARGTPDFPRTIRLRNGELRVRDDWYQAWLCDLELS